jgi:phage shock protein PspC (stress-responsive transcriptional regulator)
MQQLSAQQERFISAYLRDVALHIDPAVPASRAQRGLDLLEGRIRRAIESRAPHGPQDDDVARVLDEFGNPEKHASEIVPETSGDPAMADAVWLGVCAEWAPRFDMPVRMARGVFFVAGLFTGPLALWVYIGLYVYRRIQLPAAQRPAIDWPRMGWNVFICIAVATVLSTLLDYALWGIHYGYQQAFGKALPSPGSWGWVEYEAGGYYSLTLLCTVPLAVLASLPLAGGWDRSLKKLYLAILTLYGIYLSYGLASLVVGLVLQLTQEFGGLNVSEFLQKP